MKQLGNLSEQRGEAFYQSALRKYGVLEMIPMEDTHTAILHASVKMLRWVIAEKLALKLWKNRTLAGWQRSVRLVFKPFWMMLRLNLPPTAAPS